MAVIGSTWAPNTWISLGGWQLNTWGPAVAPPDTPGPVCGTPSLEFGVSGTVSFAGCNDVSATIIGIGNDIPILLTGAFDEGNDEYLNAAVVVYNLYSGNGSSVVLTNAMPYVAGSNGDYRGLMEWEDLQALVTAGTLKPGKRYRVSVVLDADPVSGPHLDGQWDMKVPLDYRGWNC